jgi:hypothetical protein
MQHACSLRRVLDDGHCPPASPTSFRASPCGRSTHSGRQRLHLHAHVAHHPHIRGFYRRLPVTRRGERRLWKAPLCPHGLILGVRLLLKLLRAGDDFGTNTVSVLSRRWKMYDTQTLHARHTWPCCIWIVQNTSQIVSCLDSNRNSNIWFGGRVNLSKKNCWTARNLIFFIIRYRLGIGIRYILVKVPVRCTGINKYSNVSSTIRVDTYMAKLKSHSFVFKCIATPWWHQTFFQ